MMKPITVDKTSEISANPAIRGMVELVIRLGRGGTPRSIFLTQTECSEIIIALTIAKKESQQ
jgi:hypothetical protein